VHAALGHVDWTVTLAFAGASVPFSSIGARTGLRINAEHLQRIFGLGLLIMGGTLLVVG
jgi:uncharacterized membrane protein YfcA